ncbi:FecR domain-containing protein [uncultured Formosa sp.]|uniref:FecR family protein n=1 Tax=uncultured Formosa sp. TaxID=255435 RepID=UPI00260AA923|nr:FecR domain-containing protein [uncultured Formosa sp.]
MKEFNAKKTIIKYLDSEATASEKEQLYKWVETKKNQKIFKEFVKAQQLIDIEYKCVDSESAFNDFLTKIDKDTKTRNFKVFMPYLKYAAILIGVCFATFYFSKQNSYNSIPLDPNQVSLQILNKNSESINLSEDKVITASGEYVAVLEHGILKYTKTALTAKKSSSNYQNILKVPYGKTFKVILSDGSQVYLNSGSTLKYPNAFNKDKPRTVYLEGEAYFDVAKDKKQSFLVGSKRSLVKVYGTQFNVSSYSGECRTEIVLVEGSVGVKQNTAEHNKDTFQLITPSQKALLTTNSDTIEITNVDVEKYIGWTKGVLVFENERFDNITKILERHYNISITNHFDDINTLRFNGSFQKDSIEQVLNTIKMHTNFSYTRKGKTIIITNPKQ